MNELHLQDKFLIPFFREALQYREVKANTITESLIIEEDLQEFLSETELNKKPYAALLKKYHGDQQRLLADVIALIQERIASSRNMALFINANKSISIENIKLHLFYPSDSVIHGNALFDENIFSVVQELPYKWRVAGTQIFSFRPDIVLFVNGLYIGYSELKNNYTNQSASKNGRGKVIKDYVTAIGAYHQHIDGNDMLSDAEKLKQRKDFLKIFEKAIHLTTTDIGETFVIRTIADFFDEVLSCYRDTSLDMDEVKAKIAAIFKPYPLLQTGGGVADGAAANGAVIETPSKKDILREIFTAHYGRLFIEKEILYYNFIERDVYVNAKTGAKEVKNELGHLISPRPKQKFGTDKILAKIDDFLAHEQDAGYFERLLEQQLQGVSVDKKAELLAKRQAYSNNKNVYSLLMQYAAGFGKSNIIGWSALQLKDLRRDGAYVYDKIMIVVDRLQLRSQIDSLLLNMNIDKRMVVEATNKKTFQAALASDTRLVIVNLQKFGAVREMLDAVVLRKLAGLRIAFLIDEIHRSNSGGQHEEMVTIFDELQSPFDAAEYTAHNTTKAGTGIKKNLIVGFTATPDDHTLARFGEFSAYAEGEKLWRPFDSYTMKEAIEDGFILNPLKNIVPIASKMLYDMPSKHQLEGFTEREYKDAEKKQVYENPELIDAIAANVADLLVKDVYRQIRGTAKAMLAVYSIKSAIAYHAAVCRHFAALVEQPKYAKYVDAPIHIVYSSGQDQKSAASMNDGLSEEKVLESFSLRKNGLIIVVDKLQTGFDEKRLHTLFLHKEIKKISAIQTISRVNRTTKYKNDCKIIDYSYNNVNVHNIKDAFEHFSDVVVSDFDPFGDQKILELLLVEFKKSDVYNKFSEAFHAIYKEEYTRDNPESYLDYESSLKKFIDASPLHTADTKAKAAQYFTILNRIEYVIHIDEKYREPRLLFFWRKFNMLYAILNRSTDIKDPIEVYFDNQIGIVEVIAQETGEKKKKSPQVASVTDLYESAIFDVVAIIAARNEHESETAALIEEFQEKITDFFSYISNDDKDGQRLMVKIRSYSSEDEIFEDFAKMYRRYRALKRQAVGEHFFRETEDLIAKLSDDFEEWIRASDLGEAQVE